MTARALLMAVPHTREPGFPALPEVSDDVTSMQALLQRRGFHCEDVNAIPDGLDVDKFIESMAQLRNATLSDDLAVVYFSGHGHHIPCQDASDDFTDECVVLNDGLLPDNWFRDTFWPDVNPGSQWVTCVDACFSASSVIMLNPETHPPASGRPRPEEDRAPAGRGADETEPLPPDDHVIMTLHDTPEPQLLTRPSPVARVSLSAAADDEYALGASRNFVSSWWTRTLLQGLEQDPALSYTGLWQWSTQAWTAQFSSPKGRLVAGHPQMIISDAVGSFELAASIALSAMR